MSLDLSRRSALKLLSANVALIAAGCTRPTERVLPYVHMPERLLPGQPLQYATTLPLGGFGRGVVCSVSDGKPIKVSGNALHPASLGATDLFAEAQVLSLYDPDRSQVVRHKGEITSFVALQTVLMERLAAGRAGAALRLLTGPLTSPTLLRQILALKAMYPGLRWYTHDPLDAPTLREGSTLAFGRPLAIRPRWADAAVAVTLDADPLGVGPEQIVAARGFAAARQVRNATRSMARLYSFEAAPTPTGAKADHRWAVPLQDLGPVAVGLARGLGADLPDPGLPAERARTVAAIVEDLRAHPGHALVAAGPSLPADVHALVHWINVQLSAPLDITEPVEQRGDGTLADLVADLRQGQVDTLVMSGCNPVYDAPAYTDFATLLDKPKLVLHHGLFVDETAQVCDWHLPESHIMESWGDLRGPDGTVGLVQPLIEPLYTTRSATNLLEMLAGRFDAIDHDVVRATWEQLDEVGWRAAVEAGVVGNTAAPTVPSGQPRAPVAPKAMAAASYTLLLGPDPSVYDGTFSNNAWLQECPKPLTKEVWGNSVGVAPVDAARLGVKNGGALSLSRGNAAVVASVRVDARHAPGMLTLSFGYGRRNAGEIGSGLGSDAYPLRGTDLIRALEVAVVPAPTSPRVLSTQEQFTIDGSPDEIFPSHALAELGAPATPQPPAPSLYPPHDYSQADAAWAMVIDSTACIGCNACVVACQVENNVPVVGPDEIARNRDMHWLRVDAYALPGEDGRTGFQPVPCMHCETAPCEPVCPVGASIHDSEGLNVQVYNRCVGTRFCEANCPYKVRRFNFFGYADGQEYANLGDEVMKTHNNPNVSVRARGVMEKCTFCVQRISGARREAEKQGRPLREGDVTTACQTACPTDAIHFGDRKDRNAAVALLAGERQHFTLLGSLNTKPRTTYLADVRNPNPALREA